MFGGQHDSQASVGSKCFASQTSSHACRVFRHNQFWTRVGSFCDQENMFLLSEFRQASERQELAFACTESSGAFSALNLARNLGYQCSHRVIPATLRRRAVQVTMKRSEWEMISRLSDNNNHHSSNCSNSSNSSNNGSSNSHNNTTTATTHTTTQQQHQQQQ